MTGKLLLTRFIQFKRSVKRTGYIYSFILIFAYLFVQYIGTGFINSILNASVFVVCVCVVIMFIHYERSDRDFIIVNFENPGMFFFLEYVLLSLLLTPALFFSGYYYFAIIPVLFARMISFRGYYGSNYSGAPYLFLGRIIKPENFEWISGLRKSFLVIALFYFIALALSPFKFASLLLIWLLASFVVSFYRECESLQVLSVSTLNPKEFIQKKLFTHCVMFNIVLLPLVLSYTIFNPTHYWVVLILVFLLNLNLIFTILYKYSLYEPDYTLSGSSILVTLVQLSVFFPFLFLFTLIMIFRNYKRANFNLGGYLNAQT